MRWKIGAGVLGVLVALFACLILVFLPKEATEMEEDLIVGAEERYFGTSDEGESVADEEPGLGQADPLAQDESVLDRLSVGEYGQNLVWDEAGDIKVILTGLGGPIIVVDPSTVNPSYVQTLVDGGLHVPERIVYVNAGGAPAVIRASFVDSSSDLTATVSQVRLAFNDTEIGTVLADVEAYDPSGRLVDEDRQSTPQSTYGEIVMEDPSIAYLLITTDTDGVWLSSLAFSS